MPIKPKREVIKSLSFKTRVIYGKEREIWSIYFGSDGTGNKIRASRSSKADALLCIDEFYRKLKEAGDSITVLKPAQVYDAKAAFDLLKSANSSITLTEAVRRLLATVGDAGSIAQKTLAEAYEEYYNSIADVQKHHKYSVKMRVGKWVQAYGADRPCTSITAKQIADHLAVVGRKSDKTHNNHLSYIKTFLSWCTKKERMYLAVNPIDDMNQKRIAYKEPKYMSPGDVEKMVRHFEANNDKKALVIIVLSFFCGIRTEEVGRIMDDPTQINIDDETIRISMPKGWSQGIAPRALQIPENALAWMREFDLESVYGTFNAKNTRTAVFNEAREKLGVKIPPNAGRHTFITMHVAAYGEPAKTEAMAGTSKVMRTTNYMGLASKRDGEQFFSIFPRRHSAVETA